MKLVGLISGGKDSVYNMLQCIAAGHEIVALANIEPYNKEELDSYMYQSVGHQAVSLMAGALVLPIYRQKTKGKALCKTKTYEETSSDEVEDLLELLKKVKKEVYVEGVSVGAVASDYQRTRVESVCKRLNLKCFAYLWRRNQAELLQEMIDTEMDAIIVKVASIGLEPDAHLASRKWPLIYEGCPNTTKVGFAKADFALLSFQVGDRSQGVLFQGMHVKDMIEHLMELNMKYGVSVCGEGGEYETLTVDCPLFQKAITIIDSENVILSNDAFAPVGFLNVKNAALKTKGKTSDDPVLSLKMRLDSIKNTVKNPYDYVQDCVDEVSFNIFPQRPVRKTQDNLPFPFEIKSEDHSSTILEYWKKPGLHVPHSSQVFPTATVSNTHSASSNLNYSTGWCSIGNILGANAVEGFSALQKHLDRLHYEFKDVVFVNLVVKDMSEFKAINKSYSQFMPDSLPPARVCVETTLPSEVGVIISVIAHKLVSKSQRVLYSTYASERDGMYVQSISHWAPASIGPYSQCVKVGGFYYLSGQIPLIPGAMEILNKPILHQCRLTLRHVLRVIQGMNEKLDFSCILQAICYVTSEEISADILSLWSYITRNDKATVAVVTVTGLPRKAQLEWEVLACSFENPKVDEEEGTVEDYVLRMKRCFYTDIFASSVVCKVSHVKKVKTDKSWKIINFHGINSVVKQCLAFLRTDTKVSGVTLCTLKLFYKVSEPIIGTFICDLAKSSEHKIIMTGIPVIACQEPDVFLTITGLCH